MSRNCPLILPSAHSLMAFGRLAFWGLLLVLTGCHMPHHKVIPSTPAQCLAGPIPWGRSPYFQESYSLFRREWHLANVLRPFSRAVMMEGLVEALPETDPYPGLADCRAWMEQSSRRRLQGRRLHFDRSLVAAVRTTHDYDTLWELIQRPDDEIGVYHPEPEESGPLPSPTYLRHMALAQLPILWNSWNNADTRRDLLPYLARSEDDVERLLAKEAEDTSFLNSMLWRSPPLTSPTGNSLTYLAPLLDLERRLRGPPDPISLELTLLHLSGIGTWAVQNKLQTQLKPLLENVLARRGEVPLTSSIPGAAHDLLAEARGALFDLEVEGQPANQTYLLPHRHRRWDPHPSLTAGEPAGGQIPDEDRRQRLADLDEVLPTLHYVPNICYVIHQYERWTPSSGSRRVFQMLTQPLFKGGLLLVRAENVCRLETALRLPGIEEADKVALVLEVLQADPYTRQVDQRSEEKWGGMNGFSVPDDPLRQRAAQLLGQHPEWIGPWPELIRWLEDAALQPVSSQAFLAQTWRDLTPSFLELIRHHLSGVDEADPEISRRILSTWIDTTRQADHEAKSAPHIYLSQNVPPRMMALAWFGAEVNLTQEITRFFQSLPQSRLVTVAGYLLADAETRQHPPPPRMLEAPEFTTPLPTSPPMMMRGRQASPPLFR